MSMLFLSPLGQRMVLGDCSSYLQLVQKTAQYRVYQALLTFHPILLSLTQLKPNFLLNVIKQFGL